MDEAVAKKGELDAIVATLAVIVTLMVLAMIGAGYYLYQRYFQVERFYKHSSIALEPVNDMSPACSHQYTISPNYSTDQVPIMGSQTD